MKRKVQILITFIAILAMAFTCGTVLSQVSDHDPIAVIENSHGIIHCKKGSSRIWKKCGNNTQLYQNDLVKTGGGSSAFINFSDGSYIKLLPLSKATLMKPWDDNPSTLIAVDSGRMWIKMNTEQKDAMFLVKTPDGIVRSNNSKTFVEVDHNNKSCIEVSEGVAGIISALDPENEVFLHDKQKVAMADGSIVGSPESTDTLEDETIDTKSCLPASPEKKQEPGPDAIVSQPATYAFHEEIGGDVFIIIKATVISVFEEQDNSEPIEDPSGMMPSSPSNYDTPTQEAEEEIYLTITGIINITFVSSEPVETETKTPEADTTETTTTTEETPEATGPCEESPIFFDVTVTDEEVDDTGEVVLDSELPCDLIATATIAWNTSVECGSIKSTSVGESTKPPIFFPGAGPNQAAGGKQDFSIKDNKPHEMIIKAEADNGKISFYSFTVKVQGQTSSALPEITSVTVNGASVDEDSSVHVGSTSCGDMPFVIKGSASSECGDIKEVELEVDGTDVRITGKDSWSYSQKFNEDASFPIVVRASDSSGRTSSDFQLDIALVREITPPIVNIETIGGEEPVSSSGEPMALYKNNLESGKLIVKGSVTSEYCDLTKVEASLDEGGSWSKVNGTTKWEFPFSPSDETEYQISAHAIDNAGQESNELTPIEIIYFKYTLLEKLEMIFKEMMVAYQSGSSDDFMEYVLEPFTSEDLSVNTRSNLDLALQNKFDEQPNIYLNYQTPSYSVSGTFGFVVFNWNAHPETKDGYWHSATFKYSRTGYGWKLAEVKDKDTFLRHTSDAAYIKILPTYMSSLEANRVDDTLIEVEVRDSAYNPVMNGTKVTFTTTTGTIPSSDTTTEGIAEATYVSGSTQGEARITAVSGSKSITVSITLIPEAPPGPPDR